MKKVKTYQLYTETVVNGSVVGEYKTFTEKQFKKMLKSEQKSHHKELKSHHKVVKKSKK